MRKPLTNPHFPNLAAGDLIHVMYDGTIAALMQITKVNNFSVEGLDGECPCKITWVSEQDLRFYGQLGPNRQTVLRPIQIRKGVNA